MYSIISGNDSILQQFLCLKNQQAAFVAIQTEIVDHKFMPKHTCAEGQCNFILTAQSLITCFAINKLKWINQCEVELYAKMNCSLSKLSSKSTAKH